MFKKIIGLIMFITLFLQMGGLWTSLKIQQRIHHWEILERIESDPQNLVTIVMPLNEYESCLVESDEVLWHGEMYDVKSEIRKGELVELLVFPDKEEDRILSRLTKLEESQSARKNSETLLNALSRMLYLVPNQDNYCFSERFDYQANYLYLVQATSNHTTPDHGPPES